MASMQALFARDLFTLLQRMQSGLQVYVSFFEIYGGRCQDLLNGRQRLTIREDGHGEVNIAGELEGKRHSFVGMVGGGN